MEHEIIKTLQTFLEKCNTKEERDKIQNQINYMQRRLIAYEDDGK